MGNVQSRLVNVYTRVTAGLEKEGISSRWGEPGKTSGEDGVEE